MKHIGSGQIITPVEVEQEIIHLVEQLEKGSELLKVKVEELGRVSMEYDIAYARSLHKAQGKSERQRQAEALLSNEPLYREKCLLETTVRAIRDAQHDLRAELDGVRSLGASVRASMFNTTGQSSR